MTVDMFKTLKQPKSLLKYNLMRGVTDFSQLGQFNMYESGYAFLKVIKIPKFMDMLGDQDNSIRILVDNYVHILEHEFINLDGLSNLETDTLEISNGISNIQLISKVNEASASDFTMRFYEKSGSIITRFNEMYLRGIKDPKTQVKRYLGLIDQGKLEPGYENEVFEFIYGVTDNTLLNLEKAYLIVGAQIKNAETSIYEYDKQTIENKQLSLSFSGVPLVGEPVNKVAKSILDWLNNEKNPDRIQVDSTNFQYKTIKDLSDQNSSNI